MMADKLLRVSIIIGCIMTVCLAFILVLDQVPEADYLRWLRGGPEPALPLVKGWLLELLMLGPAILLAVGCLAAWRRRG